MEVWNIFAVGLRMAIKLNQVKINGEIYFAFSRLGLANQFAVVLKVMNVECQLKVITISDRVNHP